MAKETAHQLGTPLSSLMGWLEMLRENGESSRRRELLEEMERDLQRLNKVAARFSQIGSRADLKEQCIEGAVKEVQQYFSRRLPQTGREIRIVGQNLDGLPPVPLNRELFQWVLENLIKNALDAIEAPQGLIRIDGGRLNGNRIYIDVIDNGKGIEFRKKSDVFKPGYSTKKRGWGLGLNLAKRIVEDYHGGRLFVKESRPGEGTTMRIILKH
jgi:signal transduction histidine kinase